MLGDEVISLGPKYQELGLYLNILTLKFLFLAQLRVARTIKQTFDSNYNNGFIKYQLKYIGVTQDNLKSFPIKYELLKKIQRITKVDWVLQAL